MATLDVSAQQLIEKVIPYLELDAPSLSNYECWISNWETEPGFADAVANGARKLLSSLDVPMVRSAMQALAVSGDREDIQLLRALQSHSDPAVRNIVVACIEHIEFRMKTLHDLLEEVVDWRTFETFVRRLAEEREQAQQIEKANPGAPYLTNGALGWNNGEIQGFLWSALSFFDDCMDEDHPHTHPTWRNFAEMLYCGKILE